VEHQRGSDAERHEVGQRVQLAAEGAGDLGAAGDVAVDRVEHGRDRHRGEGRAQPSVSGEHERHEAGREAAGGQQVGHVDVRPHAVPPAGP